ncbi:von Willebrand factor [Rubripirellula lacrimiformis]|uniref:von Willebrand factor n=1 Tax=Rubripirellula lacrimiformis TaxID=1930273 RepID=A0A517N3F4_9BACT|nr:von Willebrand factor type A domain-containing protein [Rubripirellula lacrimiformis]QDT01671.1 von Willebrand factor [Rubripirellula lacrimiformis]
MNREHGNPLNESELETRLVAMVMGEASQSERDDLMRIVAQRSDLADFLQQIQDVDGLLQDAATLDSLDDEDDWRLSDSKRQTVLRAIDGDVNEAIDHSLRLHCVDARRNRLKHIAQSIAKIAALLCVAVFLGTKWITSTTTQLSDQVSMVEASVQVDASAAASSVEDVASGGESSGGIGGGVVVGSQLPSPYYLQDDVQYFPATPESQNRKAITVDTENEQSLNQLRRGTTLRYSMEEPSGDSPRFGRRDQFGFDVVEEADGFAMADGFADMDAGMGMGGGMAGGALQTDTATPAAPPAPLADAKKQPARKSGSLSDKRDMADDMFGAVADGDSEHGDSTLGEEVNKRDFVTNGLFVPLASTGQQPKNIWRMQVTESESGNADKDQKVASGAGYGYSRYISPEPGSSDELHSERELLERDSSKLRSLGPGETNRPSVQTTPPAGLGEQTAADEAFSTFSLHVSDVSFKLARASLTSGAWPDPAKVRIEEFVNALDYGDPLPSQSERVSCRVEQAVHPFLQQRNVMRVSMRTAAAGRSSATPLRLTLLLDNSGSMERIDRQQTVRRAFDLLTQQLTEIDQVTLISFARQPRLLADQVKGSESQPLIELVDQLPSAGGTNLEAALKLALEKARDQQTDGAQNRIILMTDGAVNLGDANPERLSRLVTTMRSEGIAFDAAGISADGLNDEVLETLTRQGDGRYYLLDSVDAADDGFARQIAGALRPSAMNVKVQIQFNPQRVGRYKLLGFEKHRLKQQDFRNDQVDAAEMTAAEAGVAVYQFEAKPDGVGDVGSVSVRFRDVSTGQMIENVWPIAYEPDAPRFDESTPPIRIATSAALLAAKLRGDPLGETVDLKILDNAIANLPEAARRAERVQQLLQMIRQSRQLSGK